MDTTPSLNNAPDGIPVSENDTLTRQQLRDKFRNTISALQLVLSLKGSPYLPPIAHEPESVLSERQTIEEAASCIGVIEHEVTATVSLRDKQSRSPQSDPAPDVPSVMEKENVNSNSMDLLTFANAFMEHTEQFKLPTASPNHLYLVDGTSLWPQVREKNWAEIIQRCVRHRSMSIPSNSNAILINRPPILSDHMETVASYLNEYKDSDTPRELEKIFFKYLIIACWKKMYRRIFSWPSLGLIYNLSNVSQEALKNVAERLKSQGREGIQDKGLSSQLSKFRNSEDTFKDMVSPNGCSSPPVPSLSALLQADADIIYHENAVADFHFLLARLLLCFARALWRLAQARGWSPKKFKNPQPEPQPQNDTGDILAAVDKVVPIAYNLFVVANSNALREHLKLLHGLDAELQLMLPTEDRKSKYNEFVRCFVEDEDEKSKRAQEFLAESSTAAFPEACGDDGVKESRPGFSQDGDSATAHPEAAGDNGFGGKEDEEYATLVAPVSTTDPIVSDEEAAGDNGFGGEEDEEYAALVGLLSTMDPIVSDDSATAHLEAAGDNGCGVEEDEEYAALVGLLSTTDSDEEAAGDNGLGGEEEDEEYAALVGPLSMTDPIVSDDSATAHTEAAGDIEGQESEDGEEYFATVRSAEAARLAGPSTSRTDDPVVDDAVFRRWISTFVSHFTAKRFLEKHAKELPPSKNVRFYLMATNRCQQHLMSWPELKDYIYRVTSTAAPGLPDKSLAHISRKRLENTVERVIKYGRHMSKVPGSLIKALISKGILEPGAKDRPMKFHGCRHCEAMLGALISAGVMDEDVKAMASEQVLDLISVSYQHRPFP